MKNSVYIYSEDFQKYRFNSDHPFNPFRIELTHDLLQKTNLLQESDIVTARIATDEEIALAHTTAYIETVKKAGHGELQEEIAKKYGLGTEDTPPFKNMHEATAQIVGGTLTAVDYVMEGKAKHALNLGGGLHHGFKGKASGFCVYNDSSVAIKYIQKKYGAKVLYIDTDAHHGDGVQWSFYDDPHACTYSIHETGRHLFPGTGNIHERGAGKGYHYCYNIPIEPLTEDDSWLESYATSVKEVAEFFKPDVILTQNGVDSHYYDPLTHLSTTMNIYKMIPKIAHEIAHTYCNGRWIAVGGGGYDIWRVVPRAWSMIWFEMTDKLDASIVDGTLPSAWIEKWQEKAPVDLPISWTDPDNFYPEIPRKEAITEKNAHIVQMALDWIRSK